jgi:hypothetical protein
MIETPSGMTRPDLWSPDLTPVSFAISKRSSMERKTVGLKPLQRPERLQNEQTLFASRSAHSLMNTRSRSTFTS